MSSADDSPSARDRWRIQGRAECEAPGAPSPAEALLVELDRIQVRLGDVIEQGRPAFFEGSGVWEGAVVVGVLVPAPAGGMGWPWPGRVLGADGCDGFGVCGSGVCGLGVDGLGVAGVCGFVGGT